MERHINIVLKTFTRSADTDAHMDVKPLRLDFGWVDRARGGTHRPEYLSDAFLCRNPNQLLIGGTGSE
jgi:hypothetical protein